MICAESKKAKGESVWDEGHSFLKTSKKFLQSASPETQIELTEHRCKCGKTISMQSSGALDK